MKKKFFACCYVSKSRMSFYQLKLVHALRNILEAFWEVELKWDKFWMDRHCNLLSIVNTTKAFGTWEILTWNGWRDIWNLLHDNSAYDSFSHSWLAFNPRCDLRANENKKCKLWIKL